MGMLMHHTWLEQQKEAEKPVSEEPVTEEVAEETEPDEPVRKTAGRRKMK